MYDITVSRNSNFFANGVLVHNCFEIKFIALGAFCIIGDGVPYFCETLEEAEEAMRAITRALIRVNQMDSIYDKEVKRTNRIGVDITGIHEFAWKFFGYGFRDLIDEEKSKDFWMAINRLSLAVQDEARKYSAEIGFVEPHSSTTEKPNGSIAKLFALTEGWHLPSMLFYLRWVQFLDEDPLVEKYRIAGYPIRKLNQYKGTTIVGFPTAPLITRIGMPLDKIVTAAQATPEEQYKWLMLGEKYWLRGINEDGSPVTPDRGNQISYTLKFDPDKVSYEDFANIVKKYQSQVKCCSIMPQSKRVAYEYQPEEPISKEEYDEMVGRIRQVEEDIGKEHVDCGSGGCPIDFKDGSK